MKTTCSRHVSASLRRPRDSDAVQVEWHQASRIHAPAAPTDLRSQVQPLRRFEKGGFQESGNLAIENGHRNSRYSH